MTVENLEKIVYNAVSKFCLEHLPPKEVPVNEVKYITKKEAAKKLRIGMTKMNELTKSGALPSYRVGCNVRLLEHEVMASVSKVEPIKKGVKAESLKRIGGPNA